MSLLPAEAKKMLFTLRYPPDKILEVFTGSFTASASNNPPFQSARTNHTITHDFGQVFTQLTYSLDGGSTWQDQHVAVPDLSNSNEPEFNTITVGCYSTSSNIIVVASNYTSSTPTVTYKVVAFSMT